MSDPIKRKRRLRSALRVFGALTLVYVVVMSCARPADRLLLLPQPSADHVFDATARSVEFDGGTLEVFVARSPGAKEAEPTAFMLEFTGNGSRADDLVGWVASRWGQRRVEAWVMNYPGYGRSTGPARLKRIGPAGLAVYDELKTVAGGRPIYVAGNSMGTAVALHVAAHRPDVAGLILQNPPALRQIVLGDHGWWNLWLVALPVALSIPDSLDSIGQAARVKAPAVFIVADADTLVKPKYQQRVINAYAGPKWQIVLKNKTHNDSLYRRDELQQFSDGLDWLIGHGPTAVAGTPSASPTTNP